MDIIRNMKKLIILIGIAAMFSCTKESVILVIMKTLDTKTKKR